VNTDATPVNTDDDTYNKMILPITEQVVRLGLGLFDSEALQRAYRADNALNGYFVEDRKLPTERF
jgi:hypothetical protein